MSEDTDTSADDFIEDLSDEEGDMRPDVPNIIAERRNVLAPFIFPEQARKSFNTAKIDPDSLRMFADGNPIVSLGAKDIWDGADLTFLREIFVYLYQQTSFRRFSIDLDSVQYLPTGFLGLLHDWHDMNVDIRLHSPHENVRNMIWFRQFLRSIDKTDIYEFYTNGQMILKQSPATSAEEPAKKKRRRKKAD